MDSLWFRSWKDFSLGWWNALASAWFPGVRHFESLTLWIQLRPGLRNRASPKTNLGKYCLRYHGAIIWNKIIALKIPTKTSEFVFSRNLKSNIILGLLWISVTWLNVCYVCKLWSPLPYLSYSNRLPGRLDVKSMTPNSNLFQPLLAWHCMLNVTVWMPQIFIIVKALLLGQLWFRKWLCANEQ